MSKEIKYTLTQKQYDALTKLYNESKEKLRLMTFEEYVKLTIDNAIDAHLQFTSMNEKMMNMFDSTMNSMSNSNFDLNNIDEFINNIFNNNTNDSKPKTNKSETKNEDDNNSNNKKTSRIKN